MSRSRLLKPVLLISLLGSSFAFSLAIASYACEVVSQNLVSETDLECVTILGVNNIIYKEVNWEIAFTPPAHVEPDTFHGLGTCGYGSIAGTTKCYPQFYTPTVGPCLVYTNISCIRWAQIVQKRSAENCGLFSCDCMNNGLAEENYIEYPCKEPGCCGGIADYTNYPSTGCQSGFVYNGSICNRSQTFQNQCAEPTGYDPETCSCPDGVDPSPIMVDVDHSGFSLTDAAHGVVFDILNDGVPLQIAWTASTSTNAFLALDRNGNGTIDNGTELFGNLTPQPPAQNPNGFLALAEYDKPQNGGNADGTIDKHDAVFANLRLWQDANHNGISESNELHTLDGLGLSSIDLDFKESRRVDQYGNQFRYRSKVKDTHGAQMGRWAWDAFLRVQ